MTGATSDRRPNTSMIWGGRFEAGPSEVMEEINELMTESFGEDAPQLPDKITLAGAEEDDATFGSADPGYQCGGGDDFDEASGDAHIKVPFDLVDDYKEDGPTFIAQGSGGLKFKVEWTWEGTI